MIEPDLRDRILAQPERLLDDRDVMNALVSANERAMGENIVDLRGIAMQRLESRLDRLEDTHRSVIAAAYENLAGTNQVHRAVLQLLEPSNFEAFMAALSGEVAQTLRVDHVRLVLETLQEDGDSDPTLRRLGEILTVVPRSARTKMGAMRWVRSGSMWRFPMYEVASVEDARAVIAEKHARTGA